MFIPSGRPKQTTVLKLSATRVLKPLGGAAHQNQQSHGATSRAATMIYPLQAHQVPLEAI